MNRGKLLLETFWDYICCSFIHRFFLFCLISFANRFITHSSCHSVFLPWEFGYFLLISFLFSLVLNKWRAKRRTCQKGNQWHFETTKTPLLLLQNPSALLLPVAICIACHKAAVTTARPRGGDVLAVTFWQSPGEDPGSGWLSLASRCWAGAVGWAGSLSVAYDTSRLQRRNKIRAEVPIANAWVRVFTYCNWDAKTWQTIKNNNNSMLLLSNY